MPANQLYIEFVLKPIREDLVERLISNRAEPGGELGRLVDELIVECDNEELEPYDR